MKKFWKSLLIIFLPIGMLYSMGKAWFCRGDFVIFLGCLSTALVSFLFGAILIYYKPEIIQPIEMFFKTIGFAFKSLFS